MRKFRGTIIIAIVFIVFLGYYYLVPRDTGLEGYESLVGNIEGKTINEVIVEQEEGNKTIINEDNTWYVIDENKYVADQQTIEEMVGKLSKLESIGIIETNPDNFDQYGLKNPKYKLFMKADGNTQEVDIGDYTPSGDCYFAKLPNNDTVYKVGATRFKEVTKPIDELRTKQIFTGDLEDMKKIEVTREDKRLLTLINDGGWKIQEGKDSFDIDQEQLSNFVNDLKKIKIANFHNEENEEISFYGLDNPSLTIILTYSDEEVEKLVLGSSAGLGEIYGKRGDGEGIFSVPYDEVKFFETMTVIKKN
ncbi:DUF4340 domain-containing protein [Sporosalibacterium faouarense]|uniref:DUF4340 domain-containing protein n=1 Tax=Sporosalibacterium faouarense TaxID=516123 RepID=UPI00192CB4D4